MSDAMTRAVTESLANAPHQPADVAARLLASHYAVEIDLGGDAALAEFGPKLLAVLTALGATPAGRKAVVKGGESRGPDVAKDELAALRSARGSASRAN